MSTLAENTVPVPKQNADGSGQRRRGAHVAGRQDQQIYFAVSVEIAGRDENRVLADSDVICALQWSVAVSQQDADAAIISRRSVSGVHDDNVLISVAIEIGDGESLRITPDWVAHSGLEADVSPAHPAMGNIKASVTTNLVSNRYMMDSFSSR